MFNNCPNCESANTVVSDSREKKDHLWRRRRCKDCDTRWTTREVNQSDFDNFIKIDKSAKYKKILKRLIKSYINSLGADEQVEILDYLYDE